MQQASQSYLIKGSSEQHEHSGPCPHFPQNDSPVHPQSSEALKIPGCEGQALLKLSSF